MGKQAAAERAEVEAPTKKAKKEDAVGEREAAKKILDEEKRKRKEEKNKRKQEDAGGAKDEANQILDEEKRKRKEAKIQRNAPWKQAAAEEAAVPRKKTKTEETAEADSKKGPKKQAASSAAASGNELTVFIGNLPLTVPEDALRKDFSQCGEIESLRVPGKKKQKGIAFITYTCKADVEKAVKLNASDYEGCTLRVNLSGKEEMQVFVGGLVEPDEAKVKKHFGKCGKIAAFLMPSSARNCPKGIAHITFKSRVGVDKALAFNGTDYGDKTLKVNMLDAEIASQEKQIEKRRIDSQGSSAFKVFIGGVASDSNEEKLRKMFGECGEIASFKKIVPSNPEKKKDIVFITYKTKDAFEKALMFDETEYKGCTLKVKHAGDGKPKDKEGQQEGKGKGKAKGSNGKGEGKDGKGKGKDGKGKGKDGKGKGKGKGKKGKEGQAK